jgi:hypothetical protein
MLDTPSTIELHHKSFDFIMRVGFIIIYIIIKRQKSLLI